MTNYVGRAQWRLTWLLLIVVFPIALLVYAFSGCDLRMRSEKRACRHGSEQQCLAVGRFYEQRTDGLFAIMLSNATTAKQYYNLACKLNNATGCARFGHMVVVGSYDAMRGGDFTVDDGLDALEKACNAGQTEACHEFADAADASRSTPVLAKLCDAGDKGTCDKLVSVYQGSDPKRAIELQTKLCTAGDNDRCREVGTALLSGSDGVAADTARGAELLTQSCDRNVWAACRVLGEAYLDGRLPRDPARADELLAKAADHDDADACFERGAALLSDNPAKAVEVFSFECDHGDDRGCDALGDIYRVGTPAIPRDGAKSQQIYDRSCRHGNDFDCFKRDCVQGDADHCYRVKEQQRGAKFRLGGPFDFR